MLDIHRSRRKNTKTRLIVNLQGKHGKALQNSNSVIEQLEEQITVTEVNLKQAKEELKHWDMKLNYLTRSNIVKRLHNRSLK